MDRRDGVYISIIMTLVAVIITDVADFPDWKWSEVRVNEKTLYASSATLIGLATFGSVLGIKLVKDAKARMTNNVGIIVIFLSVVMLILLQWAIMLKACCLDFDLWELGILHTLTLFCLIGIMVGFVFLLDPLLSHQSSSSAKSPF